MKKKFTSYYLYAFLMLSIMGCRGCSCNTGSTSVLDRIDETIVLDSNNTAKIVIEKLKTVAVGFTFQYKEHNAGTSYSIAYHLELNDRSTCQVYNHGAEKSDSLGQYRNLISLKQSSDKRHILVNYKNAPVGVYHLLEKGAPFTTSIEPSIVKKQANDFAQNKLPSPEDMMVAYVTNPANNKDFSAFNQHIRYCLIAQTEQSPLDDKLLNHIGLMLVDSFYIPSKVEYLGHKNLGWRKKATEKVYKAVSTAVNAKQPISEKVIADANGAVHLFANGLCNFMDKKAIERQVLPKYPLFSYTIELYKMEDDRTLRKTETPAIRKNCFQILTDDNFRKTLPHQNAAVNQSIGFLVNYRDEKNIAEFEQFIAAVFRTQIFDLDPKNIEADILFPYDTRFSEAEQKIILNYAQKLKAIVPKDKSYGSLDMFFKKIEMKSISNKVNAENNSES